MEQNSKNGHNRRAFLKDVGLSTGVLTLGLPMAISGATESASAAEGKYDFDTPFNRIGSDCVKWDGALRSEKMDHIVAGMGIADMDFRTAPSIVAAVKKRAAFENWGYQDMGGASGTAFKQGIIDWNRTRYGINVINMQNLGLLTGVHAGIIACMRAHTKPGEKVLMATPIYGGFYGDCKATNTVAVESPMKYVNGRYEIDFEDFERRMTPDVKVSILCNPQNPVGRFWTREELTKYGELCLKHNIIVISDEIHCDFISKGQKYVPFATLDKKLVDNSITCKSVSKSFALPGLKAAWYFSTNPEIFRKTAFWNHADLSTPGIVSAAAAYSGGGDWMTQCAAYISDNHDFVNSYIKANIPMLKVGQKPEGTYLVWADVSALSDKIGAKKMAEEANQKAHDTNLKLGTDYAGNQEMVRAESQTPESMVVHWLAKNAYIQGGSGSGYGLGGQGHVRLNISTSRRTLKAALDSIASATKRLAA